MTNGDDSSPLTHLMPFLLVPELNKLGFNIGTFLLCGVVVHRFTEMKEPTVPDFSEVIAWNFYISEGERFLIWGIQFDINERFHQ